MNTLPKCWQDVSIAQFLEANKIITTEPDDFEREIKLVAYFRGQTPEESDKRKVIDLHKDIKQLSFLNTLPKGIARSELKIKGKRFRATLMMNEITAEQFIDITTIAKGIANDQLINQIHYLLGVILVPIKRGIYFSPFLHFSETNYDSYKDNGEWLKMNMSLADAYPYFVFFCELLPRYMEATLNYLVKEKKKIGKAIMN